jgi:hypothetical protein
VGSIGGRSFSRAEIGVATSSGRSYYAIASLLKRARIPFVDVPLGVSKISSQDFAKAPSFPLGSVSSRLKLIITTRKERLQVLADEVVCIEDLGEDYGTARQRLLSVLHPQKQTDRFVVGIDPGQRTGIAAFMNHIEIESDVLGSIDDTILRTKRLLDNASGMKRIVKIGSGIPQLAERIASDLDSSYKNNPIRIQLVDERGTSSLYANGKGRSGTRDQRSARLIAFREGRDYSPNDSIEK